MLINAHLNVLVKRTLQEELSIVYLYIIYTSILLHVHTVLWTLVLSTVIFCPFSLRTSLTLNIRIFARIAMHIFFTYFVHIAMHIFCTALCKIVSDGEL